MKKEEKRTLYFMFKQLELFEFFTHSKIKTKLVRINNKQKLAVYLNNQIWCYKSFNELYDFIIDVNRIFEILN